MKKIKLTICLTAICVNVFSQISYTINGSNDNYIKLSGTSTLHKWDLQTKIFTSKAKFEIIGNKIIDIKSLVFALAVQNLKSGEKALDKNAYKALKATEFKNINYTMSTAKVSAEKVDNYLVKTTGKLKVAGITKLINMDVKCQSDKTDSIKCNGNHKLKMSDYGVKPPTFMLGAMKTGDEMTLNFTFNYSK